MLISGEPGVSRSISDVGASEGITYSYPSNSYYDETSNKETTITKNTTESLEYDRTNQLFVTEFSSQ